MDKFSNLTFPPPVGGDRLEAIDGLIGNFEGKLLGQAFSSEFISEFFAMCRAIAIAYSDCSDENSYSLVGK